MYKITGILLVALFFFSCSPARFVKPLAKKQKAIDVSIGGPLFKLDKTTIPMPFLTATYGYGIDSSLTGFGSINITSALFGNLQMELGVTKQLLKQMNFLPGVSIVPVVNVIYRNRNAARIHPQLDLYAFWEYGKNQNLIYTGVSNWFETASKRTLEQKQTNHWFFTPVVGHSFYGMKWNVNLEVKFIAPHLSNEKLIIEYQTPLKSRGALGVYLGYTRKF